MSRSPGEAIRSERESRGWTVPELADKLGVSRQTVAYWESGETHPRGTRRRAVAKLLGLELIDLVQR